jgi:SNF2 family DNA or RNA helicase
MKYMHESKGVNRVLIACKKSIKRQWCAEIRKFTDLGNSMCIMPIEGDKKKRQKLYDEFKTYRDGVMVMNYHVVMNDYKELEKMGFDMLVIDEAHCVKARTGEMNGALKKVGKKADYIVFLTGTPIMSKPEDIFGVIQIADDKYFGKWTDFQKKHIRIENNGRYQKTIGYKELDDLRAKVQDIVIRRTEFEVTLELPETIMDKIECDIDNTQVKIKEAIQEYKGKLAGTVDTIRNKVSRTPQMQQQLEAAEGMLKGLIAADQALANDPRLFHTSKSKAMREQFGILIPQSYTRSNKMDALIELVQTILDADEKVIIFSKFETSALLVKSDIETTLKEKVLLYSGQVGEEEREQNVELFKNSFDHNVIVGTDAMAEGLNLQVANHVINFDQPDNPAIKTQRGGRARRAGSRYKKVFVHDLITVDSKDVERLANIERAQGLFDGVVSLNNAQSEAIKKAIAAEN